MKKLILALAVVSILPFLNSAYALEAGDRSMSGTFGYYSPSSSFFDAGYGFDFTYNFWRTHEKALAITAGVQGWELDGQSGVDVSGQTAFGASLDGSATLFPLGVSMIWRKPKDGSDRLDLGFQLGLQYVFATSDADQLTVVQRAGGGATRARNGVDIGYNLIGKVAIEFDYLLSESMDFVVDLGYQLDILKGDIEAGNRTIDEVELQGYFVRTGLGYRF